MTNQTQKRKLLNAHLNGIHDHLEALTDAIDSTPTTRRIKARLVMQIIVERLEELDLLLDQRK